MLSIRCLSLLLIPHSKSNLYEVSVFRTRLLNYQLTLSLTLVPSVPLICSTIFLYDNKRSTRVRKKYNLFIVYAHSHSSYCCSERAQADKKKEKDLLLPATIECVMQFVFLRQFSYRSFINHLKLS